MVAVVSMRACSKKSNPRSVLSRITVHCDDARNYKLNFKGHTTFAFLWSVVTDLMMASHMTLIRPKLEMSGRHVMMANC
jgi:hypothetical protein